jgi:branched-chain amino acid transport system permease protein
MAFFRSWFGKLVLCLALVAVLVYLDAWLSNRRVFNPYHFRIVILIGLSIILAVSLNLVNGVTGQFSIGHAGFMALGAYAAAALTVYGQHRLFPRLDNAPAVTQHAALIAAMLVGGSVAALAGLLVGLPSLRLRGDYLAIVTLGFGEIIRVAILNIEAVGGSSGFRGYVSPRGYVSIPQLTGFLWVYLVVAVVVLFSRNLLRSTHGLAFFSVREDEVAAEAMGVDTTRIKVTAFVMSAFFAGVAGALYAHYDTYLKPDSFGFLRSIEIVTMVVLGGMGSISGAVLGAAILAAVPEVLRVWLGGLTRSGVLPQGTSPDLIRQLLYALLLIVLMLTRPQGIFGSREISLRGLFQQRRRKIGAPLTGA